MLLWRKRICTISRKRWLTKIQRCICLLVFVCLMLFFFAFQVNDHNELPYNSRFMSKSQLAHNANNLWLGKSKSNLFRKFLNITAPPTLQSDERTLHPAANHFRYIINEENKCQAGSPFLLLMIPVALHAVEARQAIRNTWGSESSVPGVHIIRIFLLGVTSEPGSKLQQKVKEESMKHHDIIQQEYLDTYYNLTTKVLMGMNWVATYCPDTAYVMKIDSDMFLNPEYLIHHMLKPDMPPRHEYFTGYIMKGYLPNRDQNSKWYMPPEAYPGDIFPVFCSGTGYVFSGELAEKIYNVSLSIKYLSLEDVYMGVCLAALGIEPVPPPNESDFNHWQVAFSICRYRRLVTSHLNLTDKLMNYWKQLQKNKHHSC